MGSGDKRLGDFQPEFFLQVLMLGEEQGRDGEGVEATFVLKWSKRGAEGGVNAISPSQPPAGLLHLPAAAPLSRCCILPPAPLTPGWQNRLRPRVFSRKRVIPSCLFRLLGRGGSCRSAAEMGWWPREGTWDMGLQAARLQPSGAEGGFSPVRCFCWGAPYKARAAGRGVQSKWSFRCLKQSFPWCCRWPLCCPKICHWWNVVTLVYYPREKNGSRALKARKVLFPFHCSRYRQSKVQWNPSAVFDFRENGIFTGFFSLGISLFSNGSRL